MNVNLISDNHQDDISCIEMDKFEDLQQVRLLLSQHECIVVNNPCHNYPYRTMDVYDDLPF
jgi:hypothetical protein